jgi:hypothetical protein
MKLSPEEKASVHQRLVEIQKKKWKELTNDEKANEWTVFHFAPCHKSGM